MKQYKHKQTGHIAIESNSEKTYRVTVPQNYTVPKWMVEEGNDWEKLEEYPVGTVVIDTWAGIEADVRYEKYEKYTEDLWRRVDVTSGITFTIRDNEIGEGKRFSVVPPTPKKAPTKEDIMAECVKMFPKGSRVISPEGAHFTIADKFRTPGTSDWIEGVYYYGVGRDSILAISANKKNGEYLYLNGVYATLEEPLMTTFDGVKIYGGEKVYGVGKNSLIFVGNYTMITGVCINHNFLYFSTEEAAKEYSALNKKVFSFNDIKEYIFVSDIWKVKRLAKEYET